VKSGATLGAIFKEPTVTPSATQVRGKSLGQLGAHTLQIREKNPCQEPFGTNQLVG